jgi:hypothetical protein
VAAAAIAAAFLTTTAFAGAGAAAAVGAGPAAATLDRAPSGLGDDFKDAIEPNGPAAGDGVRPTASYLVPAARTHSFDMSHGWKRAEQRLEALPHHRAQIEGLDGHFVHGRSPFPAARPVVPVESWMGTLLRGLLASSR